MNKKTDNLTVDNKRVLFFTGSEAGESMSGSSAAAAAAAEAAVEA